MVPLTDVTQARDLFDETTERHARLASGRRRKRRNSGMQVVSVLPPRKRPRRGEVEKRPDGTVLVHLTRREWERLMRNRPEDHDDARLASEV